MTELIILLFSVVKDFFSNYSQIQKAKQERELAAINNQARLLADTESNNAAWEIAALRESDKFLKRTSFFMFSFPLVYAIYDPQAVAIYFKVVLGALPEWYIQTYMAMVGGIWAISNLKDYVPALIHQIRKR